MEFAENLYTNELHPPPATVGFEIKDICIFDTGYLTWNAKVFCYKLHPDEDGIRKVVFIFIHSGTASGFPMRFSVRNSNGAAQVQLPKTGDGVKNGDDNLYVIDYTKNLNLTLDKSPNPFPFNAKYRDHFSRLGGSQTGSFDQEEIIFGMDFPYWGPQNIYGLSEFQSDVNINGTYNFNFRFGFATIRGWSYVTPRSYTIKFN